MSVIDAALLIDVLVGLPAGRPWRRWVATNDALAAPDCAGVELGRYLRRHTLSGQLAAADAQRSFATFRALGIDTYPTEPLLMDSFAMRDNFTFDDALYVALARRLDEPLATTDARLARAAANVGIAVAEPREAASASIYANMCSCPTSSSTATRPTPSSTAPRTRSSWRARRPSRATRRSR
ncbi:MAG: type II toxin-antitoxin system VapC family toxin [Gammaproteobacteria bacterium]